MDEARWGRGRMWTQLCEGDNRGAGKLRCDPLHGCLPSGKEIPVTSKKKYHADQFLEMENLTAFGLMTQPGLRSRVERFQRRTGCWFLCTPQWGSGWGIGSFLVFYLWRPGFESGPVPKWIGFSIPT